MLVEILTKIRAILKAKNEAEIEDFKEGLKRRYGFSNFLYLTNEGLPIMGTFEDCESVSAKVPELLKSLGQFRASGHYIILAEDIVYTIVVITEDVILFAEGTKVLKKGDIEKLRLKTKEELKL